MAECPPGVHSLFDFCPGNCTDPLTAREMLEDHLEPSAIDGVLAAHTGEVEQGRCDGGRSAAQILSGHGLTEKEVTEVLAAHHEELTKSATMGPAARENRAHTPAGPADGGVLVTREEAMRNARRVLDAASRRIAREAHAATTQGGTP